MTTPAGPAARAAAPPAPRGAVGVPWFVWAAVIAATSAKVGILWDISWHRSIGRDTFWTPAHMAIYLGGVLAGLDRKSTRLNSSHRTISYAVFCLKQKKTALSRL